MLFTSSVFLFAFLPATWIGFQLAGKLSWRLSMVWLVVASLIFYGWWDKRFVVLLLASTTFNYLIGETIVALRDRRSLLQAVLYGAIIVNLAALSYFKYFASVAGFLLGHGVPFPDPGNIILPLGISFFTFTQIAYLVDIAWNEVTNRDPVRYALFVTFFPHLLAGPILHHAEIMPQFEHQRRTTFNGNDLAVGIALFVIGLSKKCLLADPTSVSVAWGFDHADDVQFFAAWKSALSYSMQLYFDFSGYSDMAIGLARMFGIRFPLNFNSPYKATSVIDYWQRWHMTLTRYLTQYLFNPLSLAIMHGISARRRRQGLRMSRRDRVVWMIVVPMMVTMGIAGVWHGAGMQFVAFGLLHGVYLCINHIWRIFRPPSGTSKVGSRAASGLLTYVCVLVGAVFFRAASVGNAASLLEAMVGWHGAEIPLQVLLGGRFAPSSALHIWGLLPACLEAAWLALLFAIVWTMPNSQQIMGRYRPALYWTERTGRPGHQLRLTAAWGAVIGVLAALAVLLPQHAEFIYFQF